MLYGPPGTGKTYAARRHAREIVAGTEPQETAGKQTTEPTTATTIDGLRFRGPAEPDGRIAHLARHGLARRYVRVEDNLSYLRGRLLFQQHVRENLTDRARFYVAHDEFNPNRPANRLVRGSLDRLKRIVRTEENRRLLRELADAFADVPPTRDPETSPSCFPWRRSTKTS